MSIDVSYTPPGEGSPQAPTNMPLAPTSRQERVEVIDILRGLALFGILAANIRGFAGPAITYFTPDLFWPGFADRLAQAFIDAFVQGKFINIFAFLFGVGFTVQLTRALERGAKFGWTYSRRLLVMVAIGFIHGYFIWFGDILLTYALVGFLLFFFAKRKDKTLLAWAIITFLVPIALMTLMYVGSRASGKPLPLPPPPTSQVIAEETKIYSQGSWADVQTLRARDAVAHNWGYLPFMGWHLLSLFLLGMLAWRRGFFRPSIENLPRYRKWMMIGLSLGIFGNVLVVTLRWIYGLSMMPTTALALALTHLQSFSTPLLSLGYVCTVIVLVNDPAWHARLQRFGAVGRTALSNYLLQSIVGTLIFYGYGLGFFGVGPAWLLVPTVAIFALQAWISPLWLRRFRFGPAEWLWRTLTYGRLQPMVRSTEPPPPAARAAA